MVLALLMAVTGGSGSESCKQWAEGESAGGLVLKYDGYGLAESCESEQGWRLKPTRATAPSVTHAALAVTHETYEDVRFSLRMRTLDQLRRPKPNPWEVAWAIWNYADDQHFYYVALKPNGWELGKEDPAYPGSQRFLATGSTPRYQIGEWHNVDVRQAGNRIEVKVDGKTLVRTQDNERPYLRGRIGLYTEDAATGFSDLDIATQKSR